jgi:hypothetical protein
MYFIVFLGMKGSSNLEHRMYLHVSEPTITVQEIEEKEKEIIHYSYQTTYKMEQ